MFKIESYESRGVDRLAIENLSALKLKGRCFQNELTLTLFPNDRHRLAFVFGRNGSGKTTIANSLASLKCSKPLEGMQKIALLDYGKSELSIDQALLDSIHVFNEGFVDKSVRISDDGLGAIVMIGETGELEEKIADAKKDLERIEKELSGRKERLDEYNDERNPISPEYHRAQIKQILKSHGGWSEREKQIKALQNAASVTDLVCDTIMALEVPERPESDMRNTFQQELERFHQLKAGDVLPNAPEIDAALMATVEQTLVDLLKKPIDKPEFSEREKRLFGIVEALGTPRLEESREHFIQESTVYCPYCFRDIKPAEKEALVNSISLVLNEAVKAHEHELIAAELPDCIFDATPFDALGQALTAKCSDTATSLQAVIAKYNELLSTKRENPYTPIFVEPLGLQDCLKEYVDAIEKLQLDIDQWNADIDNREQLKNDLIEANKALARSEISPHIDVLQDACSKKSQLSDKIAELEESRISKKGEIGEYENAKSNISIALEVINEGLAFIFMDARHLVLSGEKGIYRLRSNGRPVMPADISSGERNAIALCYYFTKLSEGQPATNPYARDLFLIVDDPISSFDQDNRIGILSFLRQKFIEVLLGNPQSRIVCLTHDGYSMAAFGKMKKAIPKMISGADGAASIKEPDMFILADGKLNGWEVSELGYTQMMRTVYEYARQPNEQLRPFIGNLTRKMLEAFATFEFGLSLSEFADSPAALERIKSTPARQFFSRLMFNLVLHAESHTSDPVYIEGIVEVTPIYTSMAVDDIVRDSLCLMYCINPDHVATHLCEQEQIADQFESWLAPIERLLAVNESKPDSEYDWYHVAISSMENRPECVHRAYLNPTELWNGWVCPYFEADEVDQMAPWLQELNDDLIFDAENDSFSTRYDPDEPECFTGQDINGQHLYPIGYGSWSWMIVEKRPDGEID